MGEVDPSCGLVGDIVRTDDESNIRNGRNSTVECLEFQTLIKGTVGFRRSRTFHVLRHPAPRRG